MMSERDEHISIQSYSENKRLRDALEEIRSLTAGDLSASTSAILAIRQVLATTHLAEAAE